MPPILYQSGTSWPSLPTRRPLSRTVRPGAATVFMALRHAPAPVCPGVVPTVALD